MNTKINKSDWILLGIVYGTSVTLNAFDYYRQDNKLIEYVIDFPVSIIISIAVILILFYKLIPEFLVYKKDYFKFFLFAILLLMVFGCLDNFIGFITAGASWDKFPSTLIFLQRGLYNCSDMIGLPIGIP